MVLSYETSPQLFSHRQTTYNEFVVNASVSDVRVIYQTNEVHKL